MAIIAKGLIGLIAVLHTYILWFEMFAWESRGPSIFEDFPADLFAPTTAMAANQGLYNGFLAAGLVWSLTIRDQGWARNVATFFLMCVAVAGVFGAATVSSSIVFVQTVPAALALALLYLGRR